jgi:NADPH:quinone reductase-like Zn-dependent oxidoreductase
MGNDAEFDAIVSQFRSGNLFPPVDRVYPLSEARSAYERIEKAEQFGKVVIEIGARGAGSRG